MTTYIERLTQEVVTTAKIGGQETVDVVERLLPALEAAFRLTLTEAATKAANDITLTLNEADVPASVDARLTSTGVDFAVHVSDDEAPAPAPAPAPAEAADEDSSARITLRLSEQLKSRLEASAAEAGQSVNTFIVHSLRAVVQRPGYGFLPAPPLPPRPGRPGVAPRPPMPPRGDGHRLQGWL